MKWKSVICALITATLLPAAALAKPQVTIGIKAEKEVTVKENGKQVKKSVVAKEVAPGDIITYTLSYSNKGDEPATSVAISDPIPTGMVFLPGSATEIGELTFSIDGGKSFKKPTLLTYEVKMPNGATEKRIASPDEYTNIRWVIDKVPAGTGGSVKFKVKVK